MFAGARILLTVAACTLVTPVAAQAPAPPPTARILACQNTFEESQQRTWTRACRQFGPPEILTIVNGLARAGKTEGSVNPQGFLVMRDFWSHFDGRIDSQGILRARATGACSYLLVW
jgi:hypothetical protein